MNMSGRGDFVKKIGFLGSICVGLLAIAVAFGAALAVIVTVLE